MPTQLVFPFGGLNKRHDFQSQPPFTSPDMLNVVPRDALLDRRRGGSRHGVGRAFIDPDNNLPEAAVRMLNTVGVIDQVNEQTYLEDSFRGDSLSGAWAVPSWEESGITYTSPVIYRGDYASHTSTDTAVTAALVYSNTSYEYANVGNGDILTVEMFIVPQDGDHWGTYNLYALMTNSAGALDGIVASLVLGADATGTYSGAVSQYLAGTPQQLAFTGGSIGASEAGWFTMRLRRAGTKTAVTCWWCGRRLLAETAFTADDPNGTRFGFGMHSNLFSSASQQMLVDRFRVQYRSSDLVNRRRRLVASENGKIYAEHRLGEVQRFSFVGANANSAQNVASDRALQSAEHNSRLYIADYSEIKKSGTDGATNGDANAIFTSASSTFNDGSISVEQHAVEVTAGSGATIGWWSIKTITDATNLVLWGTPGGSLSSLTFRIHRFPKYFFAANTPGTTDGFFNIKTSSTQTYFPPIGCSLVAMAMDTMFWAGDQNAPGTWYASRQGNPFDYDYTLTDVQAAVAATSTQAGIIPEPTTALIPGRDDYLLFGCLRSLWLLMGHPRQGGRIINKGRVVGPIGANAWCRTPDGMIWMLTIDGLYRFHPSMNEPESVSRERLPRELIDIDTNIYRVSMGYDYRQRAIHIYVTPGGSLVGTHWLFDLEEGGFFPLVLQEATQPTFVHEYQSDGVEDACLLLGSRDGHFRRYHREFVSDDGSLFASRAFYGPLMLGNGANRDGVLTELKAVVAQNSGPVNWAIQPGATPEETLSATAQESGTWTEGRNADEHPRVGANSICLKLSAGANFRPWAIENVEVERVDLGPSRIA